VKKLSKTLGAALMLCLSSLTHAGLIVDTGPGPNTISGAALSSTVTGIGQWLAGEFTLSSAHYVTDIEGWIASTGKVGTQFTITVYGDGGEAPDSGNLIYTNKATVAGEQGMDASWEGYHISFGSGLLLDPGSYWVAFEVRGDDTYGGAMPIPSTTPLANYAALTAGSGSWFEADTLRVGVRVTGNPVNPVPAPAPLGLIGLGLLAIGLFRRRIVH